LKEKKDRKSVAVNNRKYLEYNDITFLRQAFLQPAQDHL
jgi:hypothetical protein